MAQEQALPERAGKPSTYDMTQAVKMGATTRHFEVWHNGATHGAVTAVWRNETGPAISLGQKERP